jgi:tetratricopeptide (TPR) repeat protein
VAFSPDGRSILAASEDGMARVWDGDAGRPAGRLLDYGSRVVAPVAFGHGGKVLLAAGRDGRVQVWDVASGQLLAQPVEQGSQINSIALSPEGKTILTGGGDNSARLWDAATGQPIGQPMKHPRMVTSVAYSPDGKMILTGCFDGRARLWDAATGQSIGQSMEQPGAVSSVAFNPDGKMILTGCFDGRARLWDAATGRPIDPVLSHSGAVFSVAFSPDGKMILTGSADKTAQRWDAATGQRVGPALRHSAQIFSVAFSPDGRTILTGSSGDKAARLWDTATGQPIGAPMPHPSEEYSLLSVAFSPDGRFLLTSAYSTARLWDAPAPLPADLPRLAAWVETATGLEMDEQGSIRGLDGDAWRERRRRLEQLGGPPPPDPAPRLDPILFGAHPEARGEALAARGLWDQAEAAYAEAARARPRDASLRSNSVWGSLTRFYLSHGCPGRAAGALDTAVARCHDCLDLRYWQCVAHLAAGDRIGWEQAIASLLARFQGPMSSDDSNLVAVLCALAPYTVADPQLPVHLAESALQQLDEKNPNVLNTLGAALYRAGRFDDAIRRLEESILARGGEHPTDWPWLAMAHHRLGHCHEARRWLARLRDDQAIADPARPVDELEIRLLRSEAEAVILFDPVFPDDPFAP